MIRTAKNIPLSLVSLCFVIVLAGCSSNKHLSPGQSFLEDNSVKIKSREHVRNQSALLGELEQMYKQKATRTLLGIPRHWFYYQAEKKPQDTTGIRRLVRKMGDPPVILDTQLVQSTSESMTRLLYQRGYWDANVDYNIQTQSKRSRVTYLVDPNVRWTVAELRFVSRDTVVQRILDSIAHRSFLAPGAPVDIDLYESEKARITLALQNRGYANFFQNYISDPIADSSDHTMRLEIQITTPADEGAHQKYHIGQITVHPDPTDLQAVRRDTVVDNILFKLPGEVPTVNPEVITQKIYLKPGALYSRDAYDKTVRQLGRLEMYRFITLRPVLDTLLEGVINYDLFLTRNKKMGIGGDIEINYSTLAARSLMGVSGKVNYRNRNIFRGAELFSANVEAGVEVNLNNTASSRFNSANFQVQTTLLVPKFIDPIGFYGLLNNIRPLGNGLLSDKRYNWLQEGSTNVTLGYQYLSLANLYNYHSLTARLGYSVQPDNRRLLQINHVGLDYFSPNIESGFDTIIGDNIFLRESFRKQFLTGFLFRDFRLDYSRQRRRGVVVTFIQSYELTGLEMFLVNSLRNELTSRSGAFVLGGENEITFSHFAKAELDSRFTLHLSSSQAFAFRFGIGVATPYGPFSGQVPYVKQFYVGGPQSIRAWQIRELGPGGYEDPFVNPALPFYQTGDAKLELGAEYRFDIAWIFKGALFLDAGNVWTIREDTLRPGAGLSGDFLNQIAVGTGFGLRMDFSYFLIRLDFGYKLRNPYPDELGRQWLFHNFRNFGFRQLTTNFAIGYPF